MYRSIKLYTMIYKLRKIKRLKIAIIILLISTPIAHAQTNNGLLVWWRFDEGSGASAKDSSINNYTATITNAPSWVTGKYGKALNYVAASSQYVLSPSLGADPVNLTLAVWINSGSAGGVVLDELGQNPINSGWHDSQIEVETNGTVKTCVWIGSLSCVNATTNLVLRTMASHRFHVQSTTQKLTSYYDGKLGAVSANIVKSTANPGFYYSVGSIDSTNAGNGAYFTGIIDEVRIYSRVLTPTEIYELFENGAPDYMGNHVLSGDNFDSRYLFLPDAALSAPMNVGSASTPKPSALCTSFQAIL